MAESTENRQFFAMITLDMTKCTHELSNVMVLRTAGEQICLLVLVLEKKNTIIEKCKQLMLDGLTEPTWIGHLILINGYITVILGRNNSSVGHSAVSRDRIPLGL